MLVPCRVNGGGATQLRRPDRGSNLDRTAKDEKRREVEEDGDGEAQGPD